MPKFFWKLLRIGAYWLGASCAICILIALGYSLYKGIWIWGSVKATGTVIALQSSVDEDGDTQYAPVFRFSASGGQIFTITSGTRTNPTAFEVGDTIAVYYSRSNPKSAEIDNFWQLWLLPLVLAMIAITHGAISFALFGVLNRREKKGKYAGRDRTLQAAKL
jgi:Protein of unknown function (DUF3592)